MAKVYQVLSTRPNLYSERGTPVNGFHITALLFEFDETVEIDVPKMDEKTVDNRIKMLLEQRRKLDTLGDDE